ncbi:hypothetical protein AGMMS4952_13300 [Spirochaetia bacterium]|nr:hypothetical protein AGMMS4952_13300 [Spirochaetia bacterium]
MLIAAAVLIFIAGLLIGFTIAGGSNFFMKTKNVKSREFFTLKIEEKNLALDAEIVYTGNNYNAADGRISAGGRFDMAGYELRWKDETALNTVRLKEHTDKVVLFRIYSLYDEKWELVYEQDRIGDENICYLGDIKTRALRFELLETNGVVEMEIAEVYYLNKKAGNGFKVSQYLRMDNLDIVERVGDPGFSGYYDVVTDVILFDIMNLDADGKSVFYGDPAGGEAQFAANLNALKTIIGARPVRIWATVLFDQYDVSPDGRRSKNLDKTAAMLLEKRDAINAELNAFAQKYNLYGIDYDWEYPQADNQWKAYNQILCDTAEFTKVSVAIAPWRFDASPETIEKIEHFNVMCYDLFDERGYHSTMMTGGYNPLDNLIKRLKFPKEKLLLGIPTYGRAVNKSENSWPQYGDFVTKTGGGYESSLGKWTNRIQEFAYYEDGVEKNSAAYLNGYGIVRDKTLLALEAEIGGLMIFRAKCDAPYDYQYSLHRAIKEVLDTMVEN